MNELALRDIHLPEAVSWWPPAIGWWLLPVILVLMALLVYKLNKIRLARKQTAYRKMAQTELKMILNEFNKENDSAELIRSVSTLLRRIALSYLPRESIASLTGKQWIEQLNELTSEKIFSDEIATLLEQAPYRQHSDFNHDELLRTCKKWINALPARKSATGVSQ